MGGEGRVFKSASLDDFKIQEMIMHLQKEGTNGRGRKEHPPQPPVGPVGVEFFLPTAGLGGQEEGHEWLESALAAFLRKLPYFTLPCE